MTRGGGGDDIIYEQPLRAKFADDFPAVRAKYAGDFHAVRPKCEGDLHAAVGDKCGGDTTKVN